jgi:alkylation response protein AidB-like acyl-CoA dehydrogenase
MFVEAIEDILKDKCTPQAVRAIEAGGSGETKALWNALAEAGFLELLAAEDAGGAGLPLAEAFPIFTTLGRHAMPLPIAQSIVARALLAGREVPQGMITLAHGWRRTAAGGIECPLTPYGLIADYLLADDGGTLVLLSCASAQRISTGVHGSQVATLVWEKGAEAVSLRIEGAGGHVAVFAAAVHAALLAGAARQAFELTLQYGNDRSQFGKPIGKFQAIQQQISVMAGHVAAASIAAEAAFDGAGSVPSPLAAAIAKSRTSEATVLIASVAHAVHGAIGVTEEYDLQLLTRRLHEWRMAHGSEAYWNLLIGRGVLEQKSATIAEYIRANT